MKGFFEKENLCQMQMDSLGDCYHLWTPENFEIVFTCDDDFKAGMGIVAIAAALHPKVKIITFEIMSNHFHFTVAGVIAEILAFFEDLRHFLRKCFSKKKGRSIDWEGFQLKYRKLTTLSDIRTVIAYDNRNGSVVSDWHTPITYPWGANKYFFNPDAVQYALLVQKPMTKMKRRSIVCSHISDDINTLTEVYGYALPLSFCDIDSGMKLFRDPPQYSYLINKNVEGFKQIAKEMGESIYFSDNDLWNCILKICKEKYSGVSPSQLKPAEKIELAREMHFEYNASSKQIQRMLKLPESIVKSFSF